MSLWCARLTWALLPITAGTALGDALSGWSTGPARVAALLLWAAWTLGLIALLVPRPWGLTALRVVAPAAVFVALLSVAGTSAASALVALSSCLLAAGFALSAPVSQAAGNAVAYGDEIRYPLRIPISLFLGPVPLAVALTAAGVSVGPLLIADQRYPAGVAATVIGVPIAFVLARSLHSLSRRWLVLVPAGVVVADPLTLVDPVLMRREVMLAVSRAARDSKDVEPLDLRLGTLAGTVVLTLREPVSFARRRGRHDAELRDAEVVLVSTVRADTLVRTAIERRLAVG